MSLWPSLSLCLDVNECETGDHNCTQTCINTLGSFKCKCRAGYSLQDDGVTCTGMHSYIRAYAYSVCMCQSVFVYVWCASVCVRAFMHTYVPACICVCLYMYVSATQTYMCVYVMCVRKCAWGGICTCLYPSQVQLLSLSYVSLSICVSVRVDLRDPEAIGQLVSLTK